MKKLCVFLYRDWLNAASYKFEFIASLIGIIISSSTFFFIAKLIPAAEVASLKPYGGDYFSFAIIGIAFSGILNIFQNDLAGTIRTAQITGTFEALLVTPTRIPTILIGSSLYSFIFSLVSTILHITVALTIFDMQIGPVNWPAVLVVFILMSLCFLSIGILSASFILVYKKGNPFGWMFGSVSSLLGGVFFPVSVLPAGLKWISRLLPITYSLEGLRKSFLSSIGFKDILPEVTALIIFSVILLPVSFIVFRAALRKAKRDGSLTQY